MSYLLSNSRPSVTVGALAVTSTGVPQGDHKVEIPLLLERVSSIRSAEGHILTQVFYGMEWMANGNASSSRRRAHGCRPV